MRGHWVAAIAVSALAGCAGVSSRPAGPITLQDAVRTLEAGLAGIPHVDSSDLASEERGRRYDAARSFIRGRQCSAGTANPLLLTSLPLNVRLTGNLAGDGKIEFSGVNAESRVASTKLASEKNIEALLRVSTLADFPNEYLKGMSALLQAKGLPDEVVRKLKKEIPSTYDLLTARVNRLVSDFDPSNCGGVARETKLPRDSRPDRAARMLLIPTF